MIWKTKQARKEPQAGDKKVAMRFALWPTNLTNGTTCWLAFYLVERKLIRQHGDPGEMFPDTYTEWVTIRKYL